MIVLVQAAVTKHCSLGRLTQQILFLKFLEAAISKIKVPADPVFGEGTEGCLLLVASYDGK